MAGSMVKLKIYKWGDGPESEDELDDDIEIYPEFP